MYQITQTIPAAADGMAYVHFGPFPEIVSGLGSPYFWSMMPSIWHTGPGGGWYWWEISEASGYTNGQYLMIHRDDGGHFNSGQVYYWKLRLDWPIY